MHRSDTTDQPLSGILDPVGDRLLRARTIIISGEINQKLASTVSAQLLALAAESESLITLFLNSQGGHVEAGDTIHDLIRFVRAPVRMIGTGWVASAAALIFVSVPREQRFCLPNTRFLLHQPAGGAGGSASDIDIEAKEIIRMRDRLNRLFAKATGQPLERIEEDTHRNFWLDAAAAQRYGLVGRIIENAAELNPPASQTG
jgi:ATP-dependent Clp protease protease subunit